MERSTFMIQRQGTKDAIPEIHAPMTLDQDPAAVFVYGSLMRGLELHHHMEAGTFVGTGCVRGRLISLGRYPGLLDGDGAVRGEVYRFADVPAILDVLDDIEDFDATDPDASIYLRVVRSVELDDGRELCAWLYVYNRPARDVQAIECGDWRAVTKPGEI